MARIVVALVATLAVAGCGSDTTIVDCASAVVWQGRSYDGAGNARGWRRGERLGAGETPACGPDKPAERTTVYAVRGVPAAVAVAGTRDSRTVFLARGYFPQLATHPLHQAFFADPNEPRARRCRGHWNAAGTVKGGGAAVDVATDEGERLVFLHARPRVRGATRFGTAYLPAGTRARFRGRSCVDADSGRQRFADLVVVGR
jgi:hypothetical protein